VYAAADPLLRTDPLGEHGLLVAGLRILKELAKESVLMFRPNRKQVAVKSAQVGSGQVEWWQFVDLIPGVSALRTGRSADVEGGTMGKDLIAGCSTDLVRLIFHVANWTYDAADAHESAGSGLAPAGRPNYSLTFAQSQKYHAHILQTKGCP